jgi:hypothetical protein
LNIGIQSILGKLYNLGVGRFNSDLGHMRASLGPREIVRIRGEEFAGSEVFPFSKHVGIADRQGRQGLVECQDRQCGCQDQKRGDEPVVRGGLHGCLPILSE